MSWLVKAVLGWIASRLSWFAGGALWQSRRQDRAAIKAGSRAREIDDEVAGLDEPALDDRLRDLRQ